MNVLRYYLYLALTGAFLENHCAAFGTNSTANHLVIVGGQSPTLKNPSGTPHWNLPSVLGLADESGVPWRAYAASGGYPVAFYTQLKGSADVVASSQFTADARAGSLPSLVMLWHDPPLDEHPTADITLGMNVIWQSVDAVVQSGGDGRDRLHAEHGTTGADTTITSRHPSWSTRPITSNWPTAHASRC